MKKNKCSINNLLKYFNPFLTAKLAKLAKWSLSRINFIPSAISAYSRRSLRLKKGWSHYISFEGVEVPNLKSINLEFWHHSMLSDPPPSPPYPDRKHRDKEGSFFFLKNLAMRWKSPFLRQRFSAVGRGWGGSTHNGLKIILILLILTIAPLTSAAQQFNSDQQLQQYLKIAAENNPEIQATFYNYLASLQKAPQVGTLPDPKLMFGYFIAPVETRLGTQNARFSISQMFPWFGTLDTRSDAAVLNTKAQFSVFQDKRNRLFYRVKEKWYALYILNKHISIVEENIDILQSLVDLTLQKYQTGSGNQADVLQAQIELENLRVKKQELIDDRKVFIQEFQELLNATDVSLPAAIPDILPPAALSMSREQLIQRVLKNNPKLTRLDFKKESVQKLIKAARLSGYPKFGIGATYMFIDERPITLPNNGQDAFMASFTIKIPLYRDKYEASKKQAKLQKKAVQYREIAVTDNLVTAVETALRDYREVARNYELYSDTQIQRLRQALDVLRQEYATGITNFEELLRLQRQLLSYRLAKAKALGKQHTALAKLEYLYGKYNIEPEEISK